MQNKKTTIIIVGAGVFGLSCAYHLAGAGLRVAVYDEQGVIGAGASGGIVGALSPHTPDHWNAKKQFQYESLRNSAAFWAQVDAQSGQNSGYGRIGRIIPLSTRREWDLAQKRVQSAPQYWDKSFDYRLSPAPDCLAPQLAPFGVIHETLSARLFPADAIASLAGACQQGGVQFYLRHRVDALSAHCISGPWGRASADAIVLAGGGGGFALLDRFIGIGVKSGQAVKGQAALLAIKQAIKLPQIYADGLYIIPHSGGRIAVGSSSENRWQDAQKTDAQLDGLIARAKAICPALQGAKTIQRWAGLRPRARKIDPMLGQFAGLYIALGGFKIGFGIAPKIGSVMRDLILGRPVHLPRRFSIAHHLDLGPSSEGTKCYAHSSPPQSNGIA